MKRIYTLLTAFVLLLTLFTSCSKPFEKMSAAELLDLGEKYLLEMNYEKAIVYFEKMIDVEPQNPYGYTGLAEAYIGQDNIDDAIATLNTGIEQLHDRDFLNAAAEIYIHIIDKDPANEDAYIGLADVYISLGRPGVAVTILQQGLDVTGSQEISDKLTNLKAPGVDSTDGAERDGSSGSNTVVDWKQPYLEILLGSQKYAANFDWETHDYYGTYPSYTTGFLLADLNFDGIPELMIFGDGAGMSEMMRIFTITDDGTVEKVFQDWGYPYGLLLYRNKINDSLAYSFTCENGEIEWYEGRVYITDRSTHINSSFAESAKIAEFASESNYDYEGTLLNATYTFNGDSVSENDYNRLRDNVLTDYEEIPYEPAILHWDYEPVLTDNDFLAFLDSYQPEKQ